MGWLQLPRAGTGAGGAGAGAGQVADGPPELVAGIRALAFLDGLPGGPMGGTAEGPATGGRIVSATGWQGGLILRDAATLAVIGSRSLVQPPGWQGEPALSVLPLAGRQALVLHGQGADAQLWWADLPGMLDPAPTLLDFGGRTITALSVLPLAGGGDALYTTDLQSDAITQWQRHEDGRLDEVARIAIASGSDTAPPAPPVASGAGIVAPQILTTATGSWLIAAETGSASLSLWQLDAQGGATPAGRLTAAGGLAVSAPSALALAQAGGRDFILLGAAGSGSITVIELTAAGDLVIRDHVLDDRATRFAGLSVLQVVQAGDFTLVLAGGADDGLSLMALLPGGRLVHLETVDAGLLPALMNPLALVVHVAGRDTADTDTGDMLVIDIAGEGAAGQGRLELPLAALGAVLQAGAEGGTLTGTAGGDILVGGTGADVLQGGPGADLFVMGRSLGPDQGRNGVADVILDFTPGEDAIDISAWGRIRDIGALNIGRSGDGVMITWGDESLQVFPAAGHSLLPGDFNAGNLLGLDHIPVIAATPWQPPPPPPDWPLLPHLPGPGRLFAGTAGDDVIAGTAGDDVIFGGGGRDRLSGGGGNDLIFAERTAEPHDTVIGQVVRLYRLVLGREPDGAGLADWSGRLLQPGGDPDDILAQVVRGFIDSPEFRSATAPGSEGFVAALLGNMPGNAPDDGPATGPAIGPDTALVADGVAQIAAGMSREQFTLSLLGDAGLARAVIDTAYHHSAAGIEAEAAPLAWRLLAAVTGAPPDTADFAQLLEQALALLVTGATPGAVVAEYLVPGHALRPGQGTNVEFVTRAYEQLLGRPPDDAGLADWTARLRDGASRADIIAGIAGSAEFAALTAPALKDWMRAQGVDDRIEGGRGDNILAGGIGADVFVFVQEDGGRQRVLDLEPWDFIELHGFGHESAAEAMARISQRGADAVFADQGVEIIFHHVDAASLDADMFLLF